MERFCSGSISCNNKCTLAGVNSIVGYVSLSVTTVYNQSNVSGGILSPTLISAGNYTVDGTLGTIVGTAGRTENYSGVNVTYIVTHQDTSERNANLVSNNITGGTVTFFGFSNTFFTFAAIVVLFAMFGILLRMVGAFGNQGRGNNAKFSE